MKQVVRYVRCTNLIGYLLWSIDILIRITIGAAVIGDSCCGKVHTRQNIIYIICFYGSNYICIFAR